MKRSDLIVALLLLGVALVVPILFETRYIVTQITVFFIWATVVTQWNLVFGVAGIFSLAQMALFAMGAYVTAMLCFYLKWSWWAAAPVGGLAAMLFSMLIGIACLRLRGPYVALLTFAVAQAMLLLIITDVECFIKDGTVCVQLTGGVKGFSRYGDFGFRDLFGAKAFIGNYYVALGVLLLATIASFVIIKSPLGLAFRALRDNVGYAMARGISRFKFQVLVFAVSAFFTGLAGAVYAAHFRVVAPNILYTSVLVYLVAMMVLGGLGRFWGPLVGAALLMSTDEVLKEFLDDRNIGIGLVIILCVTLLPGGVVGAVEDGWARLRGKRKGAALSDPLAAIAPADGGSR